MDFHPLAWKFIRAHAHDRLPAANFHSSGWKFISPLDLIPDTIPGVGLLDDAVVVGRVIKSVRKELEQFRAWEVGA
jgi:hypothetical protein